MPSRFFRLWNGRAAFFLTRNANRNVDKVKMRERGYDTPRPLTGPPPERSPKRRSFRGRLRRPAVRTNRAQAPAPTLASRSWGIPKGSPG